MPQLTEMPVGVWIEGVEDMEGKAPEDARVFAMTCPSEHDDALGGLDELDSVLSKERALGKSSL